MSGQNSTLILNIVKEKTRDEDPTNDSGYSIEHGALNTEVFIESKEYKNDAQMVFDYVDRVTDEIESGLYDMNIKIKYLNEMKEKVSTLEADLMARIDHKTWLNIAEFIGMSLN